MIRLIDLFADCTCILGAAAFVITIAIAAAHHISREDVPLWHLSFFRKWVAATGVAAIVAAIPSYLVSKAIRTELQLLAKNNDITSVIIYNNNCKSVQSPNFIYKLAESNAYWSNGGRTTDQVYKVAVLGSDTLARFELIQNSYDSKLYQVYFFSKILEHTKEIGAVKINPSLLQQCK